MPNTKILNPAKVTMVIINAKESKHGGKTDIQETCSLSLLILQMLPKFLLPLLCP